MPLPTKVDPDTRRRHARSVRHAAQQTVWAESKLKRLRYCGRVLAGDASGVAVRLTGGDSPRAGFSGLQSCGSTWACPVCSEKIQAVRQSEVSEAIRAWQASGGSVVFGTTTLRHNRGHRLEALWDAIAPAWNRTTSGAGVAWQGGKREIGDRARFGVAGIIRLVEVKHGGNGWHPHIHFLMFLERDLDAQELEDFRRRLFGRWERAISRRGFSVLEGPGLDLRRVSADSGDELADYFAKSTYRETSAAAAAYEVTNSQHKRAGKGGRAPFELLADLVRDGDADDLDLWHEWEQASRGRRQLTWSHGFRRHLLELGAQLEETEVSDEDLVEQADLDGEVLVVIDKVRWKAGRWAWRRAELLDAAERGTIFDLLGSQDVASSPAWSRERIRRRR